jgi:SAM-dependent methyltransferase
VPVPHYRGVELDCCQECGLVFLGLADAADFGGRYLSDEYVETHDDYLAQDVAFRHIARQRIRWLSRRAAPGPFLELGPGRGHLLAAARQAGFDPIGVEPSPRLAARIAAEFGVPVERGFLSEVELPHSDFNVICMYHVLEHVEDPVALLDELRELLTDGGILVIEVPNIASAMARRRGEDWPAVQPAELHVSQFTPSTLCRLVERAGLKVAEVDTVSPWHYLPLSLRLRPRALIGYAYRTAQLRTLRETHPSGYDNLRLLASVPARG